MSETSPVEAPARGETKGVADDDCMIVCLSSEAWADDPKRRLITPWYRSVE